MSTRNSLQTQPLATQNQRCGANILAIKAIRNSTGKKIKPPPKKRQRIQVSISCCDSGVCEEKPQIEKRGNNPQNLVPKRVSAVGNLDTPHRLGYGFLLPNKPLCGNVATCELYSIAANSTESLTWATPCQMKFSPRLEP